MGSIWSTKSKEFERLENRVHGWSEEALLEAFMGELKLERAEAALVIKRCN